MKHNQLIAACALALMSSVAAAAPTVNGFDLATFDFNVTTYTYTGNGTNGTATASGTSNGIGWSISPTNLWNGRTTTNGTFSFASLPNKTDNLHASIGYTITFAQTVDTLIVALSNDNLLDSINFNLTPSFLYGNVANSGTQINLTNNTGGLVWFNNVNSITVTNVDNNDVMDGYDLAFHAIPVPEPETYALMLVGLGLVGFAARRRTASTL
jgi:opacity protein-like surface antigen